MSRTISKRHKVAEFLPEVARLIDDEAVVEISLNPDGNLFVERSGQNPNLAGQIEERHAKRFLRYVAVESEYVIDEDNPTFSGSIPGTPHRIEGVVPPIVKAASFSIRRHRDIEYPLSDYFLEPAHQTMFSEALLGRNNILIAGETGAGKSSFGRSALGLLADQCPDTRLVVIEDTDELKPRFENCMSMLARKGVRSMEDLLESTLRLAPDRIIIGELRRGADLMMLLNAWSTGHRGGLATIHADSASDTLARLKGMAAQASLGDQTYLMGKAIDLAVFLQKRPGGGKVTSMTRFSCPEETLKLEPIL